MTKTTSSVWNNTIKNISRLILGITLLMVCSLSVKAQQTTWTGTIDSDWETSGNWDSGIPGTNDDAIIPNNSAVDPIISGTTNAVAKSLTLGNMNLLTINTGGSLTIDGASSDGILINGSIQCNGTINVDNTGGNGISISTNNGQLTNSGTINIGQNGAANSIAHSGFYIGGPFVNRASGQININNTTWYGIKMLNTTFDNFGTINTDKPGSSVYVYSALVLSSNSGGTFTNKTGANLTLKGFSTGYNGNSNTSLVNEGTITFENLSSYAIDCIGSFTNTGTVKGNGLLEFNNTHSWTGILSPGLSPGLIHSQSDFEFSAGAILEIEVEGTNPSQYDRIGGDYDINLGGTLAVTINYAPTFGDRIVFLTANNVLGTFDAVNPALPANWSVDYSVSGEVVLEYTDPLPVELMQFNATLIDEMTQLIWLTASETNNEGFEIQHSINGRDWITIGFVNGHNDSELVNTYHFQHEQLNRGLNYYRLKQTDFDGHFEYSDIRVVEFNGDDLQTTFFPNPTMDVVNVTFSKEVMEGRLILLTVDGRMVLEKRLSEGTTHQQLSLNHLPKGVYWLQLETEGLSWNQKIVLQ